MRQKRFLVRVVAVTAVVFGLLTVVSGGTTLAGMADRGAVVPFVLWFNFLAGFAYVAAGAMLWRGHPAAGRVALLIFAATAAVFAAFGLHVLAGGAFEARTVAAMSLRTGFWGAIAWLARRKEA